MIIIRYYLNIATNNITGPIPTSFKNLSKLNELWLHESKLSGVIPSEIGGMVSLTRFGLHDNNFTGTLPNSVGNLVLLEHLSLCVNDDQKNRPPPKIQEQIPGIILSIHHFPNFPGAAPPFFYLP